MNSCRMSAHRTVTLALWVFAVALSAHAQTALFMSPMRVEIRATPGEQITNALTLGTTVPEGLRARGEVLDFDFDATATPQFMAHIATEEKYSCRNWLSVNPMVTTLPAGTPTTVRYTLKVPAGTPERGYHCAIGFESVPSAAEKKQGMGMVISVRVVAAIYVVVGSPKAEPHVGSLKVLAPVPEKDQPWRAVLDVENTGELHVRPIGRAEVIDSEGRVVETVQFPTVPTLPRRVQSYVASLKTRLDDGNKYTVRARVDIGTGEIQEARVVVTPQR